MLSFMMLSALTLLRLIILFLRSRLEATWLCVWTLWMMRLQQLICLLNLQARGAACWIPLSILLSGRGTTLAAAFLCCAMIMALSVRLMCRRVHSLCWVASALDCSSSWARLARNLSRFCSLIPMIWEQSRDYFLAYDWILIFWGITQYFRILSRILIFQGESL